MTKQFRSLDENLCKSAGHFIKKKQTKKQRTNGPVNAHLRSGIYTNKLVFTSSATTINLFDYYGHIQARDRLTPGVNIIFRTINILFICPFPRSFSLQ